MNDLQKKFLPRFLASARERLARVEEGLAHGSAAVAAELHALAGEAAMLGLDQVADVARAAEIAARRSDATPLAREVAELRRQVAALAGPPAPPP